MMTKREFLNAVVAGEMSEEMVAWAAAEIEKMDRANEKRRNAEKKDSKAAVANREFYGALGEFLGEEPHTASEIGAHLGVSAQKASAIMRQAVKEGVAAATDLKIKGRAIKGYTAA